MNIEELKRLAEDATPGPWEVRAGVLRKIGEQSQIATIYRPYNSQFIAAANPAAVLELIQKLEVTQDELDIERLRLAACGVVAMQNTEESRKDRIGPDHRCYSASYIDVCRAVDAEIELRKQRDELLASLKEARELVEDWGAYAPAYMQEKHDLQGDLDKLDASIAKEESKT